MEWRAYYYETLRGECPVEEFLLDLSPLERAKCLAYIDLLEQQPLGLPASFVKQVTGKLWELRPELGGVEMRLLYFFFVERKIVFVHALKKKRQALDRSDVELAVRRMAEVQAQQAAVRARVPEAPAPPPAPPTKGIKGMRKQKGRPR